MDEGVINSISAQLDPKYICIGEVCVKFINKVAINLQIINNNY